MKVKRIVAALALVALIAVCGIMIFIGKERTQGYTVVSTNFVGYDFARAIIGDVSKVKMLLKPASEMHNYEPTPQDIIDIANADFFIYTGGESDEWVADVLRDNDINKNKTIRMMDYVELKNEELKEGMEGESEDDEYDEHIWTSPVNAIRIIQAIRDHLEAKNMGNVTEYSKNAAEYISKLEAIDAQFRDIVKNAKRKELIFADRFPFRYFVDEYGLNYYAAFPGCAEQTEASSKTIAFLIDKVKADQIPVVLKIELTSDALAQTIAQETGAKILTLDAAHNIPQADFDAGKTYADIMTDNQKVLEEALN